MATILDALLNADYNLRGKNEIGLLIGKEQLHNAVVLLEKGYGLSDEVEDLILAAGGEVKQVPAKG